jgi:hypothetical protein
MSDLLLVLWVALLAADRIDLAGGAAPFLVTPFLAITPLVLASEALGARFQRRDTGWPASGVWYLGLALLLLSVATFSVYGSPAVSVSAPRATLLAILVLSTAFIAAGLVRRPHYPQVLARGAAIAVGVFAVFDVLELGQYFGALDDRVRLGPIVVDLVSARYGGIAPRLSGAVGDPNRAGLLLLIFGYAIAWSGWARVRTYRWLGLITVLGILTISRSAAIAAIVTLLLTPLVARRVRIPIRALAVAALLAAAGVGALMRGVATNSQALVRLAPLANRLSVGEASGAEHLLLLRRGFQEATRSTSRTLLGIGYGASFTVLDDIFPGNRYGNFHSLYITMFAECGIFALLLMGLLLAVPLLRANPYRALIGGLAAFNVFYQSPSEPVFWLVLALAWMTAARPSAPMVTA